MKEGRQEAWCGRKSSTKGKRKRGISKTDARKEKRIMKGGQKDKY